MTAMKDVCSVRSYIFLHNFLLNYKFTQAWNLATELSMNFSVIIFLELTS